MQERKSFCSMRCGAGSATIKCRQLHCALHAPFSGIKQHPSPVYMGKLFYGIREWRHTKLAFIYSYRIGFGNQWTTTTTKSRVRPMQFGFPSLSQIFRSKSMHMRLLWVSIYVCVCVSNVIETNKINANYLVFQFVTLHYSAQLINARFFQQQQQQQHIVCVNVVRWDGMALKSCWSFNCFISYLFQWIFQLFIK